MKPVALSALIVLAAGSAAAQHCKNAGSLGFVGVSNDSSRSVWLSRIAKGNPGDYRLEAAQGNTQVDAWGATDRGGLRLSLSPFVSSGNGGVHRLFQGDCMIDTQNQKGGIVIPALPSRPPAGITPPIAVLPPGGLAPQLPGGVRPPIGTLPPGGLMPGRPGAVSPPIATLPPSGLMPGRPGAVSPPIATLPPSGVMPGRPGPVRPPSGSLPSRPGLPSGPGAPSGPGTPGTPSRPDVGTAEIDRAGEATLVRTAGANPCADRDVYVPGDPDCEEDISPPLTTGRDLVVPNVWNAWADFQGVSTDDDRYGRDGDGHGSVLTLGIDRAVSTDLVIGFQLSIEQSTTNTFGGALQQDMSGIAAGPYFAALVSPRWVLDGSLTWGRFSNEVDLLSLEGDYDQTRTLANLNATGQYEWGAVVVRPRASVVYARYGDADYDLSGDIAGIPVDLDVETPDSEYGNVQAAVEFSRPYFVDGGILVPFLELGVGYDFLGNDEIVTGDLGTETSTPWAGSARLGFRGSPTDDIYLEASIGYLSAFQQDLDVMGAGLFFAYSF